MEEQNDIKCWLVARLHDSAETIQKLIKEERHIEIERNDRDRDNNYGFSFPGVNDVQKSCLIKIRDLYSAQNIRPSVLDLGAGHGLMSWKILTAGGHLTAIEKQIPTARALQKKVMQAKPFLAPKEILKNLCLLNTGDVCDTNIKIYQALYDVTWSGNLIHLLSPIQATAYVENLYKITKPGGYAFASVHSASKEEGMLQYFFERKNNNVLYPGFFITNKIQHYSRDTVNNWDSPIKLERVGPFCPAPLSMSPTKIEDGFYNSNEKRDYDFQKTSDGATTYKMRQHSATHFFDPESLSYFFKNAGFDIEESFFFTSQGKKVHGNPSYEEMLKNGFAVGIVAHKPQSIEEKK